MTVPVVSRPNEDLALIENALKLRGQVGSWFGTKEALLSNTARYVLEYRSADALAALARVQARIVRAEKALTDIAHLPDMSEDWHDGDVAVQIAREALAVSGGREDTRVTHGRHCSCSGCAKEDWTRADLAPCGMHGEDCPNVYAPVSGGRESETGTP